MKIRTQLLIAFLLLAIVPLSAIVLFSYVTSLGAVRSAVEEESRSLTDEMDGRMGSIRNDLMASVTRLGQFPFRSLSGGESLDGEGAEPLLDDLVLAMGDTARLVRSLEFVPAAEAGPAEPVSAAPVPPDASPPSLPVSEVLPDGSHAQIDVRMPEAVIIDVPRIVMEIAEAKESIAEGDVGQGAAVGLAFEVLGGIAADLAEQSHVLETEIRRLEEEGVALGAARRRELEAALEARNAARREIKLQLHEVIEARRRMSDEERAVLEEHRREQRLLFGREFQVPVEEQGEVVGHVTACVAGEDLLAEVLERSTREEGEVPFAVDREGNLYTVGEEDRALIDGLALERSEGGRWRPASGEGEWVVATSEDEASGLTFGIARPIRRSLAEVRRTAARNFGFGLGLVVLGLVGIQPLTRRMTRNLEAITRGADRIAKGDLQTRVPVRSRSEFGRLAEAFNRMAEDLSHHQERALRQRLLEAEYERKSEELEEARRFQLSLLPRCLPELPHLELAVAMTTATEVGGDFYDFYVPREGVLSAAVGDATGHGAKAGTMVTVVKSLLTADAGASRPAEFLRSANRAIRRMELERMAMALCMARFEGRRLTVASAGMPPVLVHRAGGGRAGEVQELALAGMPLGGLDETFGECTVELEPGDTVLLMSDGFPELPNHDDDPLGYSEARRAFAEAAGLEPREILDALHERARRWRGHGTPADDLTFVVARVGADRPG
ncbi:MAG: SpoIIE family protein phosphatase [Acidobacteriota bacterium]|jgi:serine phosphatase RsbU (regulator of sigma subunit)